MSEPMLAAKTIYTSPHYNTQKRGRGRPPSDAALILDRGGELFFPGLLPAGFRRRFTAPNSYLRQRGKHIATFPNTVKDGVQGVAVYAIPDDAPNDGTWGLVAPRYSSG